MSDLELLLEKVRAAEGPMSTAQVEQCIRLSPWYVDRPSNDPVWSDFCKALYGSVDAAIALIEREMPEANCWGVEKEPSHIEAYVSRNNVKSGHWMKLETGATPALALCAAFLSAKIQTGSGGTGE